MYTQDDLQRLDAAIASGGAAEVQFADGQRIRYRTVQEMLSARNHVASVLADQARNQAGGMMVYPTFVHSRER